MTRDLPTIVPAAREHSKPALAFGSGPRYDENHCPPPSYRRRGSHTMTTAARYAFLTVACLVVASRANAQQPPTFQHHVLPVLKAKCLACHGADKQKGRLDLRTLEATLKGGKHGPAVVRGKPDESVLWQRVDSDEMPPPDQPRLTAQEKEVIRRWIEQGKFDAVAANKGPRGITDEDRNHWAFRKPVKPAVPVVKGQALVKTPVDAFVLAKLEAKGLTMNAE